MTNIKAIAPTPTTLIEKLTFKPMAKIISMQETPKDFVKIRLGQEVLVNWAPKAIFSRSLADFADMSFLEWTENALVYLGPKLLGENVFRKVYSSKLSECLKKAVAKPAAEILKDKNNPDTKKLIPIKAAIAISALAIPIAEYSLNYVKNLFTLKVFKQADFNNIANLNKQKSENTEHQKKVKESAKKHLKLAGGLIAGCLALSALILTKGRDSKNLRHFSEFILAPGSKIFKKNADRAKTFNKYFGLDFDKNDKGKLILSNGQLTACVVIGGFGYFGAAKDRGKQNFKEVLYRFPLVGLYMITGSDLIEKGFKPMLQKLGKCKELLAKETENKKINKLSEDKGEEGPIKNVMPKLEELKDLAETLATKNKTSVAEEYKKLFKQKMAITGIPMAFGLVVMGFFVAGLSRYFTQYRYNKEANALNNKQTELNK